MRKWIALAMLFFCFRTDLSAQTFLSGKILKSDRKESIEGVNIQNLSVNKFARSGSDGRYEIQAAAGDRIVFSSAGYHADTILIRNGDLMDEYNIYLRVNIVKLEEVEVDPLSKYVEDSIRRQTDYADLLNKKHPVKMVNEKRSGDAPGFSFSPIGYNSKKEKDKRRLLERIQEDDEAEYIDAKFSRQRVAYLTKLSGDSLRLFMVKYRPSYAFCRSANNGDMLLYINDKFVLYKKQLTE